MIDYEVGEIPSTNLGIAIRDQNDNPISLIGYPLIELQILDTDDRQLDVSDVEIVPLSDAPGRLAVVWPKDRSLFEKRGKYLLRLILKKIDGSKDITRTAEIRVRDFGRLYN